MTIAITPATWHAHVAEFAKPPRGVTPWFCGDVRPKYRGWYERVFVDGIFRHYWSGSKWFSNPRNVPHWRQVGDYPAWRGLRYSAFMSPSRYPAAR